MCGVIDGGPFMSVFVRRFHVCDAKVIEQALVLLQSCCGYRETSIWAVWCSVSDLCAPVHCVGLHAKVECIYTFHVPCSGHSRGACLRKAVNVLCCVQAEHAASKVCLLPPHLLKTVVEATL